MQAGCGQGTAVMPPYDRIAVLAWGLLLAPPVVAQTMVTQGTRDQDKQAVDNEVNADIKAMNEDKDRVEEEEIRLKGKLQGKETDEATKAAAGQQLNELRAAATATKTLFLLVMIASVNGPEKY